MDDRIVSRRSVPFHDGETFEARIWIFTDITEARYARQDCLTGLKNRRAFSIEFPRFVEGKDPGMRAVAVLDVDNFKKYNDVYGHAAGDEVLRSIGHLLRHEVCAAEDCLYRIGGEEFLVARKTRSELEASVFFETVRKSIEDLGIAHAQNPRFEVITASVGLAVFPGSVKADEAFARADQALYAAKNSGRNQVHISYLRAA